MAGEAAERAKYMDDVYRLVRIAVETRRPLTATYHKRERLFCPHRLGRNKDGQLRALCYQYGGESESGLKPVGSPGNWRCIALDQLSGVELLNGTWQLHPTIRVLLLVLCTPMLMPTIMRLADRNRLSECFLVLIRNTN